MTTNINRLETDRRNLDSLRLHLGPLICNRLDDWAVNDIMLNPNGMLFEDRQGVGMTQIGVMSEASAMNAIGIVASLFRTSVTHDASVLEGELPIRNARFIAYIPPTTCKPSFTIRLPAPVIFTLVDYVADGIMTAAQAAVTEQAVRRGDNILVAGGTGSGKTTLVNAVLKALHAVAPAKRVCIIEEIVELQCSLLNTLALRTSTNFDQQDLLKRAMRSRPDVIVIGEVRDKAALVLVKAANTGHGSIFSTIHANDAAKACLRVEQLCREGQPHVDMRDQIADALGVIVSIARIEPEDRKEGGPTRRVNEVIRVVGVKDGGYIFERLA